MWQNTFHQRSFSATIEYPLSFSVKDSPDTQSLVNKGFIANLEKVDLGVPVVQTMNAVYHS